MVRAFVQYRCPGTAVLDYHLIRSRIALHYAENAHRAWKPEKQLNRLEHHEMEKSNTRIGSASAC